MTLLEDYIVALTMLYGIVHKRTVVKIYNEKNDNHISVETVENIMQQSEEKLTKHFVYIEKEYFIHEYVVVDDSLDEEIERRQGKPHYIPATEAELLEYTDDDHVERTKQFLNLLQYVLNFICDGDHNQAMEICLDVTGKIQADFPFTRIVSEFEEYGVVFEGEKQLNEIAELVMNHMNHTRLRSNNGHTPKELSAYEPHFLAKTSPIPREFARELKNKRQEKLESTINKRNTKVGRNAPCPCGSGKKYKKCCMK